MADNSQHGAGWAVPAESTRAPGAGAAGEVDFAHHALPDQVARIGLHHFAHEFVAWRPGKSVIAPLQFQISVADAGNQQADYGVTLGALRTRHFADIDES